MKFDFFHKKTLKIFLRKNLTKINKLEGGSNSLK